MDVLGNFAKEKSKYKGLIMNQMRELTIEETTLAAGGHCSAGLVDSSSLVSNLGCITVNEFFTIARQLFFADIEPPAFRESFGSVGELLTAIENLSHGRDDSQL